MSYEPTVWKTGDIVSSEKLNKLENSLASEESRAKSEEARLEQLFVTPTQEAVNSYLDAHPEATTTVQDGAITYEKLSAGLKEKCDDVDDLKADLKLVEDGLSSEEYIFSPDWVMGYINGSNGNEGTNTVNCKFATVRHFRKGDSITQNNYQSNSILVHTYNSSGVWQGYAGYSAYTGMNDGTFVFADDAYIRLVFAFKPQADITPSDFATINSRIVIKQHYTYERLDDLELSDKVINDNIKFLKDDLNGNSHIFAPTWHYGFISGTGVINNTTSVNPNRYSDLFFVPAGTILASAYTKNTNVYSYNSSGVFIEALGAFKSSPKTIMGDKYIRLSMELESADATGTFDPNTYITVTIPPERYAAISGIEERLMEPTYSKIGAISNLTVAPVTFPVSIQSGHKYKARYKTSSDLEQNSFYLQIWSTESIGDPSTVLKNYGNVWGTDDTSDWLEYTFIADAYYEGYFRFGYAVSSVPSGVTEYAELYDLNELVYYDITMIDHRITDLENEQSFWAGKKIVWFGTSIPAGVVNAGDEGGNGAYPTRVGQLLGATVYNEAIGSSAARIGMHGSISASDPNGYAGVPATCCLYSLAGTVAEKQAIINDWNTWKNIFTIGVNDIDPSNPTPYYNASYENKLAKYLTGGSVGQVDLYVFDHGYNDGGNLNGSDYSDTTDVPLNPFDRTYFIGAMNFLIDKIKKDNFRASIVIVSHYNDEGAFADLVEAQEYIANKWNIPFINISNKMGFTTAMSVTINGTTKTMKNWWLPDGIHPSSDTSGKALKHYAEVLYPFIRDAR